MWYVLIFIPYFIFNWSISIAYINRTIIIVIRHVVLHGFAYTSLMLCYYLNVTCPCNNLKKNFLCVTNRFKRVSYVLSQLYLALITTYCWCAVKQRTNKPIEYLNSNGLNSADVPLSNKQNLNSRPLYNQYEWIYDIIVFHQYYHTMV